MKNSTALSESKNFFYKLSAIVFVIALALFFQNFTSTSSSDIAQVAAVDNQPPSELTPEQKKVLKDQAINEAKNSFKIINLKANEKCLESQLVDACLPLKNPVYANGASFQNGLNYGMDLSKVQTIPVKWVPNNSSPDGNILENKLFRVFVQDPSDSPQITVDTNDKILDYSKDNNKHVVTQSMLYYILNDQVASILSKAGLYYVDASTFGEHKLFVNAYSKEFPNNAYFRVDTLSLNFLNLENISDIIETSGLKVEEFQKSINFEMGLSGEVASHELGHADFFYANINSGADFSSYEDNNENYIFKALHCPVEVINSIETDAICNQSFDEILIFNKTDYVSILYPTKNVKGGLEIQKRFYHDLGVTCNIMGCLRGLDEGQADLHAFIHFDGRANQTKGESIVNDYKNGYELFSPVSRNPQRNRNLNLDNFLINEGKKELARIELEYFKKNNKGIYNKNKIKIINKMKKPPAGHNFNLTWAQFEKLSEKDPKKLLIYRYFAFDPHSFGAFYASVLWEIRDKSGMTINEFAKVFMSHLTDLSSKSNTSKALASFVLKNRSLYPVKNPKKNAPSLGKNEANILAIIKKRGVTVTL